MVEATARGEGAATVYVAPGMPPLDLSGRPTSYFEFWPTWLMYSPVALLWLGLSLRHGSLTLPLLANPALPLSGMVGVPKSAVFEAAGERARRWILPYCLYTVGSAAPSEQGSAVLALLQSQGLGLPVVAKPDIGCRGAGVRLLASRSELEDYLAAFPVGADIQLQRLSQWQAEAGVFYVRHPQQSRGELTSITLKYTPYIVGDGEHSIGELVARDARAGGLLHLYRDRHQDNWERVLPAGEAYRLLFSASHCRGAIFRDASGEATAALRRRLDDIFADIPEFYYGRLDIKFRDLDALREGRDFDIIEINGASAESIHIWDRDTSLRAAIATLLGQYRTLFRLGAANRRRGFRPPGIAALWRGWRREARLVSRYPEND